MLLAFVLLCEVESLEAADTSPYELSEIRVTLLSVLHASCKNDIRYGFAKVNDALAPFLTHPSHQLKGLSNERLTVEEAHANLSMGEFIEERLQNLGCEGPRCLKDIDIIIDFEDASGLRVDSESEQSVKQ